MAGKKLFMESGNILSNTENLVGHPVSNKTACARRQNLYQAVHPDKMFIIHWKPFIEHVSITGQTIIIADASLKQIS